MHTVGRTSLVNEQFKQPWAEQAVLYVISRQNYDGGYTFYQGAESCGQYTYYGLAILDILHVPFPNIRKTVKWLNSFSPSNIYSLYYVTKGLELCKQGKAKSFKEPSLAIPSALTRSEEVETYMASIFGLESIFLVTELINMTGIRINCDKVARSLLNFQNGDGGFGVRGHSNLESTYYAISSLTNLGYKVKFRDRLLEYVRSCEKPSGGFTVLPENTRPYLEYTYFGMLTLDQLGERAKNPDNVIRFVLECQNLDGGFARSSLGMSMFENVFYAVKIIEKVGRL